MIPNIVLTSAGAALLAKIPAGEAAQATRWQIGKGSLTSGSSLDRTALVDPVKYLPLYQISNAGNTATVLGQFTNQGETAGFDFEELGLLAQDLDGGEILFAYGNAFGDGEAIQPGTEQLREFIFGAELIFSGAANVTGEISHGLIFIPESEKGVPHGVAALDSSGKLERSEIPDIDCGEWDTEPVAEHDSTPTTHQNLMVDGNNTAAADHSETLEEHMENPMAHQNLMIDGNAGR